MQQWEWAIRAGAPMAPYLWAIVPGLLVGWMMVQMVKTARRDRGLPKLSNTWHRLIAMTSGGLGSLIGSSLTSLTSRAVIAIALLTGLLCPMFWGFAIGMTRDSDRPWVRRLHWAMRGNRRRWKTPLNSYAELKRWDDTNVEDTWF